MTERKRSSTALIATIVVVVLMFPVLYYLSLGPVAWLQSQLDYETVTFSCLDAYCIPADSLVRAGYGDWISNYVDLWLPETSFQSVGEALSGDETHRSRATLSV